MVCTAASWGLPLSRSVVKLRTRAVVAFGSANSRRWHGSVLCWAGSVPVTRQRAARYGPRDLSPW